MVLRGRCQDAAALGRQKTFASLRPWMAYQQMADPQRPVPELLDTFFNGYFGPAAGDALILRPLVNAQELPRAKKQLANRAATLSYLRRILYTTAQRLFDAADGRDFASSGGTAARSSGAPALGPLPAGALVLPRAPNYPMGRNSF